MCFRVHSLPLALFPLQSSSTLILRMVYHTTGCGTEIRVQLPFPPHAAVPGRCKLNLVSWMLQLKLQFSAFSHSCSNVLLEGTTEH
ncbi:hypothetical protein M758_UG065700 [Ceratodon purpureus]|nr:hypothetical protein M758_UG065700 [Ceratodon purpureus]